MTRQLLQKCRWATGLRAAAIACVCATLLSVSSARADDHNSNEPANISRIIHTFDFNEPKNFDTIPRYWIRFPDATIGDPSFPRYTEAKFDKEMGHHDNPSFYLESKGQSIGYRYVGPETRIRPGTFRVRGWIKADALRHGRAAISAYFVDWNGRYIGDTQKYSRLVGGAVDGNDWQQVEIELKDVPVGAQFIGVTCWLVQQDVWRDGKEPHRHIDHMDIFGGAWFDDIEIIEEPFAELKLSHPGNIVHAGEVCEILATVADDVADGLVATLMVHDESGKVLASQSIPVRDFEERQATIVTLPELTPGIYNSSLTVRSGDEEVLKRTLRFAQLGKSHHPPGQVSRRMGITLKSLPHDEIADVHALFDALDVGIVKIPLWGGDQTTSDSDSRALPKTMSLLLRLQVEVVGLFGGLPNELAQSRFEHNLTLLDVLSDDPRGWRPFLDDIVAPHANVFRSWQLGADGDLSMVDDPRYGNAIVALRQGIHEMIAAPDITGIQSASVYPDGPRLDVENLSVHLPEDIYPEHIADHLGEFIEDGRPKDGYDLVWASVGSGVDLDAQSIGTWALRILEARWAGVDAVFAAQPWTTRRSPTGLVSEPTLAYLAFRTIADIVDDKIPSQRLDLDLSAKAMTFVRGDESVWVIWDPKAPPEGRSLSIQLGSAREIVDLLGRQVSAKRLRDGRHELIIGRSPIFVVGSQRWLPAFRAGVQLTPSHADFALDAREHTLKVSNPNDVAMNGMIVLASPEGWTVEPSRIQFSIYPNEVKEFAVAIRHPSSESAGIKQLFANVTLNSTQKYYMEIPLLFDLDLQDVDVWGYAVMDGDRLVVRHGMTSRADVPISLRSFATYPGRSRQYRVIHELLPGQTLATEYTFSDVESTVGKTIRLGLREVNGPRIHNLQIDAP
ncbi:MAG: hypothetical protein DHS20C16_10910 [Phycisphaerae bacterium]|nr:MAG: hypothetical protein DHS20C16_10910 [Phycisphaerae bacterium]